MHVSDQRDPWGMPLLQKTLKIEPTCRERDTLARVVVRSYGHLLAERVDWTWIKIAPEDSDFLMHRTESTSICSEADLWSCSFRVCARARVRAKERFRKTETLKMWVSGQRVHASVCALVQAMSNLPQVPKRTRTNIFRGSPISWTKGWCNTHRTLIHTIVLPEASPYSPCSLQGCN